MNRFHKRHLVLLSLLAIALAAVIFYLRSDQNSKSYSIRPFDEAKDLNAVVNLVNVNKYWVAEIPDMFSPEQMLLSRAPSSEPHRKGSVQVDVAEVDNKVAGFITYYRKNPENGFIWILAVDKEFRGRGIGEGLAMNAIAYLKRMGSRYITLGTRTNNQAALALYKKLGFVEQNRDEERGMVTLVKRNL